MSPAKKNHWLPLLILFAAVYLLVAIGFPNPPVASNEQFMWRLAAWLTCIGVFAIHIGLEHFRLRSSAGRAALHVAMSVALGALGLAAAANIHALRAGAGNHRLRLLALVVWPIMTGMSAFLIALSLTSVLHLLRPNTRS